MRTIIVGDVHGCASELEDLLDALAFTSGDRLVFVGDLVARGPRSLGVLDLARVTGAVVVRGNHEQRLLDARADHGAEGGGALPPLGPSLGPPLGKMHRDVARALRPVDWSLLESSVLHLDLPEHGARVVHAGVDPRVPFERQDPATLLRIRTIPRPGSGREDPSESELWGVRYEGPPHVVFGHNAAPGLQLHPWATGLDTGCVYGGRLTALVLAPGQKVPRSASARRQALVSVPARRVWFAPTGRATTNVA